ncbi:acyltransferase family protein [Nonomuraea sp. CA-141351]|uniref:acyltransferase family protein n=1 Tax=Nonomuraea sp. CA-141351 TaxID=3239996 RepID=UPI003D8D6AEA
MSDTRFSPPVKTPRSPEEDAGGPAQTGARWPLPEEAFWSEEADPHGVAPGELTEPQPAVRVDDPQTTTDERPQQQPQAAAERSRPQPRTTTDDRPQQQPEPQQEPQPPKRKRDPFLDNVKFVLIALVPIGHSLVPTLAADSNRALYIFIYTFHMPLFVLISGYLSRNFWNSNAKTNKLVDTFLVPYVIVEVGYALLRVSVGQKWSLTIIDPAWLNWYLLALLFWRLSTPVWKRMKYPVPVAIAIYLFAGFSQISGDFSMDRFFGLMPFFVIGLVMQPEHFEMLNRRWIKILGVLTILGAAAVAIYLAPKAPLDPFYFKASYQDLHLSWYMGLGLRVGLLVCSLAMCFAVLALVPRGETWFSDLGTRTLYCYLLHGIPVLIAKEMGWLEFPWLFGPLGALAIASSCFALAIVLCLPETRTIFKWVLEPRLVWLYRRPSRS